MIFKRFSFLLVILFLMSFGLPKNLVKKIKKEIISAFSVEEFELISKSFSETLPASFNDENLFEIKTEGKIIGYAYVGKAPSKTDTFDYLILFDSNFVIKKSKVLAYREDYGGEIGSKRWLKQFIGKTKNDELKLHEDIVAISGATISVRSMTKAVNDVLASIKILHHKNLL